MPPSESSSPIRSRHPRFYFRDGSVVMMDTETLYRLHLSVLENRSTIFRDIFSLPFGNPLADAGAGTVVQPSDTANTANAFVLEGQNDNHPFELPAANVTPSKFDNLVTYLYTGTSGYPGDMPFLLDVLDLSSFFDIADGVQYVVGALEYRPNFSAVQRFKLARTYNIHQWIEPAIRDLVQWDTTSFTLSDVYDIGIEAFHHIVQAKSKIMRLRVGMAYKPPALVKGPDCQGACEYAWSREWWNDLGKYILHPQWMASGSSIKTQIEISNLPGVCESCRDTTVEGMALKGAFEKDKDILEAAVAEVKKAHGDFTPPRLESYMPSHFNSY
ncbi:hypothetical protein FA13DRAFT_1647132 [Coprinellus micaceus]|uniref:BTB domain-containing protein n=1 Tax=Coprinellus micaceus TaxID=71717 RepID=A0A4Y7SD90_COPMI|nr:hypothetical protein FA13DRAFT_1647132 [Coprinellus micaceus]